MHLMIPLNENMMDNKNILQLLQALPLLIPINI
jgi:hypothetical protein